MPRRRGKLRRSIGSAGYSKQPRSPWMPPARSQVRVSPSCGSPCRRDRRLAACPARDRDPVDRMLIAQAATADLVLVSNEAVFDRYAVHGRLRLGRRLGWQSNR